MIKVLHKNIEELEEKASSYMTWLDGEGVTAMLDWDENGFYLWFEPAYSFEQWCDEVGERERYEEFEAYLYDIGVFIFSTLESVNECCNDHCGDNNPAMFIEDEYGINGV